MSHENYWDQGFQRRILYLLIRKPEISRVIHSQYFGGTILSDICAWVTEIYEKHPESILAEATLRSIARDKLGKKRSDVWPVYKGEIKTLFSLSTSDDDVLAARVNDFVREKKYRAALVEAERHVNSGDYPLADKALNKLKTESHPAEPNGPKLHSFYLHQFLGQDSEKNSNDLVQHIVPRRGATMLYGLPKETKSWIGLQLAIDVAAGHERALDYFPVPQAARVLYVQVEDRDQLTRERIEMMTRNGSLRRLRTLTNLRIIPRCGLNLTDEAWVVPLRQEIERHKPKLIVFDVFRRLFHGNASDSQEVAAFLRVLDDFRDTYGAAIVLIHHAKKSESSEMQAMALGSVNLSGWAEALLYTSGKHSVGDVTIADLEIVTKSYTGKLEIVVDAENEPIVRVREESSGDKEALVKLIRENDSINQKELERKSGIGEKKVRKILKQCEDEELVKKEPAPGKRHEYAYHVLES